MCGSEERGRQAASRSCASVLVPQCSGWLAYGAVANPAAGLGERTAQLTCCRVQLPSSVGPLPRVSPSLLLCWNPSLRPLCRWLARTGPRDDKHRGPLFIRQAGHSANPAFGSSQQMVAGQVSGLRKPGGLAAVLLQTKTKAPGPRHTGTGTRLFDSSLAPYPKSQPRTTNPVSAAPTSR